ncbi:MAG: rplI [Candidatus Nomurabacteria bacterium]|nr:rplI [Candidatus Nomurabacteria bacterium]
MKVILLKSVPKVGKTDDIVEVSEGYARNALFAKKLAVPATPAAIAEVQRKAQNKITEKKVQHDLLDRAIESLDGRTLIYKARANEKGSLFSKVTEQDISNALLEHHRISIDPTLMKIDGPIKQTGTYTVSVKDAEYKSEFTVSVEI